MCVASMVADFYQDKWRQPPYIQTITSFTKVSRVEFEILRKEVQDMKELLKRAKIYDENTNQPDCEIEEKINKLREVAKLVGIDLDDALKKKSESEKDKEGNKII